MLITRRPGDAITAAAVLPLAAGLALVAALHPRLGVVLALAGCAVPLCRHAGGRLALFAAGVIFLFQSTSFGAVSRGTFVVAGTVASLVALRSARRAAVRLELDVTLLLRAQLVLVGFCALQVFTYALSDVSLTDWVRDGTTYVLLAAAPSIGLDAALHTSARTLQLLTVSVALVGGLSYTAAWLDRRQHTVGNITQFALVSSMLIVPGIVMCLVLYFQRGGRRLAWLSMGVLLLALMLAAGGRSTALYVAVGLSFLAIAGLRLRGGVNRTLGLCAALLLAAAVTVTMTETLTGSDYLIKRLSFFRNASLSAVQEDASGQQRLNAYSIMLHAFTTHPLLGNGFGHNYPSALTKVVTPGAGLYTLDTPLTLLAKFGLIGTACLVLGLALLLRGSMIIGQANSYGRRRGEILLLTCAAMWLGALPNGAVTEQKGFAVGIALLIAVAVAWCGPFATCARPTTPARTPRSASHARSDPAPD